METVQLKRYPRKNWAGVPKYDNAKDRLTCFLDKKTGYPKTGLTKEDAVRLEKALRMEEGSLMPWSDFWRDFQIPIEGDQVIYLDPKNNPEDELKYLFLKGHKLVADGYEEVNKNPKVMYVLYNEVDEAKANNLARKDKKNAYAMFAKMTPHEMADALVVLGKKVVDMDPEVIEDILGREVEADPTKFMKIVGDQNFKEKLFVMKLVQYGVINKGRGHMNKATFFYEDEFLGEGLNAVVDYMTRNSNQTTRISLQKRLEMQQKSGTLMAEPINPVTTDSSASNSVKVTSTVESDKAAEMAEDSSPAPKPKAEKIETAPATQEKAEETEESKNTKAQAAAHSQKSAIKGVAKKGASSGDFDEDPSMI